MNIKIYTPEEQTVRLKLMEACSGVKVVAMRDDGEQLDSGNLIRIDQEGKLHRYTSVNPNLGFKLDSKGRIELD